MSEDSFTGVGPFVTGLSISEIGRRSWCLTKAAKGIAAAGAAVRRLGQCQDAQARSDALALFSALPAPTRRKILSNYRRNAGRNA